MSHLLKFSIFSRLRAALTAMDREKDSLSMALDDKTEVRKSRDLIG